MPHLQSIYIFLLHLFIILQFLPYCTSQQQSSSPPQVRPNHAPAVIVGMFMFTVFFSFLACCICYKYSGTTSTPGINSDIEEGGRGRAWSRRTIRGLDKDVINSFPCFVYSQVKGIKIGKGGVECAICLNEFEDDETLRLLPPCSHVYHSDCIDVWLNSRSTCPVCRANLVPKPGNDDHDHDQIQSFPYPFVSQDNNHEMDLGRGNTRRNVLESAEMHLIDNLRLNNNESRPPRSRSTGSSNWRITEILFPRSHSTGHSLVQLGENLDRFTLQLPEEVRRELISLNLRRSHTTLPQARSSPLGYRSGSVGNEQRGFGYGRQYNRRNVSLSFSFSFQASSLQSSPGRNDLMAFSKNLSRSIKSPFRKASVTSQSKEKESGERSFERLRPDMV